MKGRPLHLESAKDIAIVGMAGFFPQAPDVDTYWRNVLHNKVATEEVPEQRWNWRLYYDSDPARQDKMVSRWGAYLPDIVFDPLLFGLPPKSLNYIEAAQLLTLESTRLALADAGYADRPFDRQRTSVFIGTGAGEGDLGQMYSFRSMLPHYFGESAQTILAGLKPSVPEWDPDAFTGVITNITAGRVANRFNLGGTNCTIDAACASALAALRAGILELRAGESEMVIVGGADTLMSPFAFSCFSKVGALSPKGECRAFDEKADGIVLGEVVATVILKRLADAQRDGDRVYAVIKGIGASSDGRAKSLTAPSRDGQLLALKRAYENAGIEPARVGLIEAHGTGTKVGDQSEAEALTGFFSASGMAAKSCAVGSVKSMIGHAKCAAGIASLIKSVLALYHKVLPPTWGVEKPIAELDGPDNPLYLNTRSRPWIQPLDQPRYAGVSAFGFGGTNFHVILEEARLPEPSQFAVAALPDGETELLVFRAEDRAALARQIVDLKRQLRRQPAEGGCALKDLACTLASQYRGDAGARLALVSGSMEDLIEKLSLAENLLVHGDTVQNPAAAGICFHEGTCLKPDQIAFVFPGQGSQYAGMFKALGVTFASVRKTLERFDAHLHGVLPKPLSRYILPPDQFSTEARKFHERDLTQTHIAQPAMGAVDTAMLALLDELGIRPAMTAGHSYGEYVALHAAGVLDERSLALVSEARGRFILAAAQPEPGTMAAVKASEKDTVQCLEGLEHVWIANLNAPRQTVISGTREGVRSAIQRLGENGISCVPIPVACAFHSPVVAGARDRLKAFLGQLAFQPAGMPVYSNTSAALFPKDVEEIRALLVEQLVRPVRFVDEIEAMYASGARLFVEVGAGDVLTRLIDRILDQRPHTAVCTDIKTRPGLTQLQHALARMVALGVPLKLETLFARRGGRILDFDHGFDAVQAPISKSAFIIGKGGIRPAAQSTRPQAPAPRPIGFVDELPTAPPELPMVGSMSPRDVNHSVLNGETMDTTKPPAIVQNSAIDAEVMAKFQDLMSQFLETQRAVMTAYLGGGQLQAGMEATVNPGLQPFQTLDGVHGNNTGQVRAPAASTSQDASFPPLAAEALSSSSASPAAGVQESIPAKGFDVAEMLLRIVSDRTGYPPEMLELNLEIESDLGIDSIKRVQITETLVAALEAQGIVMPTEALADVAGSVTLMEIIDKLNMIVDTKAPRGADRQPIGASVAAVGALDVTHTLVTIVSDRTGYPADMLGLELEIESDLGIDSIKRVQITETLVTALEAQGVILPTEELAAIAGSVTLGEIIAQINNLIVRQTPPAVDETSPADAAASQGQPEPHRGQTVGEYLGSDALYTLLYRLIHQHTRFPKQTFSPDTEWHLLEVSQEEKVRILDAFVAAVVEKLGGAVQMLSRDQGLAAARLSQTVDWLAAAPCLIAEQPHALDGRAIRRYLLTAREKRLLAASARDLKGQTIIVTRMPGDLVAEGVFNQLRELQANVLYLSQGSAVQTGDGQRYVADLTESDQVAEVIGRIRQQHGPVDGLVHLVSLAPSGAWEQMSLTQWRRQLSLEVKSLFYLSKLLADDLTQAAGAGKGSLVAVTAMGDGFGSLADPSVRLQYFPGHGAVTGFLKTLALEVPGLNVRALDLDPGAPLETRIHQIIDEWTINCTDVEVAYQGDRRIILDVVEAPIDPAQSPLLAMDSSWRLLVTGGARGITATIALDLARRYQPTLLVVGRTPLTAAEDPETAGINDLKELKAVLTRRLKVKQTNVKPRDVEQAYTRLIREREVKATLAQLEAAGARVTYFEADVTDETSFGQVIDTIYEQYGRIDGVLHGAGMIQDKMVRDKEVQSFSRVFDTKADSLFILSRKLRSDQLRFLALFSSVAGRFGNVGQADYAAANEVYNKTAVFLNNRWPGRVISLMWGPWESQGMVSSELQQKFESLGVSLIPPQVGSECFIQEIAHGAATHSEVIFGGWHERQRAVLPAHQAERLPLFFVNANFKPPLDGEVEVVRRLDIEHDRYLLDHQLDGHPVMPMAIALEMMAEAVAYRYPDYYLTAVSDLKVYRGIIMRRGCEHVRVVATPLVKSNEQVTLKVTLRAPEAEGGIYYEARVELGKEPLSMRPHVGIDLKEPVSFSLPLVDAYQKYLFHGPLWQGIEEIESVGQDGIIGRLKGSRPENYLQGAPAHLNWVMDPLIIDSGLQLVAIWLRDRFDATALPSQMKKYMQYCPAPGEGALRCEVRIDAPHTRGMKEADLYFIKSDNHLFARIQGLEIIGHTDLNRLSRK